MAPLNTASPDSKAVFTTPQSFKKLRSCVSLAHYGASTFITAHRSQTKISIRAAFEQLPTEAGSPTGNQPRLRFKSTR